VRKAYELIEDQHDTIMEFVSSFEKAVEGKEYPKAVLALIAQTREFAQFHFTIEESLMQIVKYADLGAHRDEHQSVLKQIASIEDRVRGEEPGSDWLPLLRACLFAHFNERDKDFNQYAMERSRESFDKAAAEHPSLVGEGVAMNTLAFYEEVGTGNAMMDVDHKNLVDLFNLLANGIEDHMGRDFCRNIIEEIDRTTKAHFAKEQRLMAEVHYPMASQHAGEHAMLLGQLHDFMAEFVVDSSEARMALVRFAEVWLDFHILFSDKKFAEFLASMRD